MSLWGLYLSEARHPPTWFFVSIYLLFILVPEFDILLGEMLGLG